MTSHVVHLGDCLDPVTGLASLPDKSVDHVICDPPYSAWVHAKHRVGQARTDRPLGRSRGEVGRPISRDKEIGFEHIAPDVARASAVQFARVCRRWTLVFSDVEAGHHLWREACSEAGLEFVRTGLWHKLGGTPQFTGDRPAIAAEAIVIVHPSGRKRWNGGGKHGLWPYEIVRDVGREEERVHTTQKPIALMEALVRDFTDAGETVLDPFAGSGTTGVACKRLGRSFIGWERDEEYHAIAAKRISAAKEQLGLWTGAA